MLHYYDGSVFNTNAKTIVNAVNCMGVMGAGIALEFKLRYPQMFDDYKEKCERKEVRIGKPYVFIVSDTKWVLNFPTKAHWKYPSKMLWIEEGLRYFKNYYHKREFGSIAFPKLGCNNGGLSWEAVKPLMEKYLNELDIDIYICLDEKNEPEGTEKEMLDLINNCDLKYITDFIGLNKRQAGIIINNQPIKRFRLIEKMEGIGQKSYVALFKHYYNKASIDSNEGKSNMTDGVTDTYKQLDIFGNITVMEKGNKQKNKKKNISKKSDKNI